MPGPHPAALRDRVVEAYVNGEGTYEEIAERFRVGVASVDRWVALQRNNGSTAPAPMGGARGDRLIDEDGEKWIVDALGDVPDATIAELVEAYEREKLVRVSWETMRSTVARLGFTRKRGALRAPAAWSEAVVKERKDYAEKVPKFDTGRLVFLDETWASTALHRTYGWSRAGEQVFLEAPHRGRGFTVIGAIALDGVRAKSILEGSVDGPVFLTWLRDQLGPALRPGDVVVMDNLRTHKVEGVEEIIAARGAEVMYLPRYSPEYNPIELCWAYIKASVRRIPRRTLDRLRLAVESAWCRVTTDLCVAWTEHCGYPMPAKST